MTFARGWQSSVREAAARMYDQAAYIQTVYTGAFIPPLALPSWHSGLFGAAWRGIAATFLALCLACTSVFRGKLARGLRIGAFLEGPMTLLRAVQSGHPGDYFLWITVGVSVFGSIVIFALR